MRDADADAIRTQLDIWENGSREQTLAMHRLEVLRDLLLRDDDALTVLLNDYPGVDAQRLRTLIREGRKEAHANTQSQTGQDPQRKNYRKSEERRGGKESGSTCRSRWSPYH